VGDVRFSVVVPAHNEEELLGRGLDAIAAAAELAPGATEVIVVANRCTDATEALAREAGARVVRNEARNISAVRNAGAAAADGEILVTVDADSVLSPFTLRDAAELLDTGRYVGGGVPFRPERRSLGIASTAALVRALTFVAGLSGAVFWCRREDFEAIGGFDEEKLIGEDLDFARRLRAHGRMTGRKLTSLRNAPVVTSCRKFDRFGDWHMFAMGLDLPQIYRAMKGRDTRWVDRYFFDFNDELG
jgi:glycosyltransferase involved in cell wall biosynthesis